MKLFTRKGAASSRRSNRLWLLRLKKFGLGVAVVCALLGLIFHAWNAGFFSRAGQMARNETMALTKTLGFEVGSILISGRDNIAQEELLEHLGIEKGAPLFEVSLESAQEELQKISWIKSARLSRRLPDTIGIDIVERKPVALWQHNKKIFAIDAEGAVLGGVAERHKNLPLVVGEGAPARILQISALLQAEPGIAAELASAVLVGQRRWDLRLKNGIVVKLPEDDVELALSKLAQAAATDGLLGKNVSVIDLRLEERMSLTLKGDLSPRQEKNI